MNIQHLNQITPALPQTLEESIAQFQKGEDEVRAVRLFNTTTWANRHLIIAALHCALAYQRELKVGVREDHVTLDVHTKM